MTDPLHPLAQLGGVAHVSTLRRYGVTRQALDQGLRLGSVERIRAGWYSRAGDAGDAVQALRVGGRLSCVSLLRAQGVWVMNDERLHVAVSKSRDRLCAPHDRAVPLRGWSGSPRVVTHWGPFLAEPLEPVDRLDSAVACVAACQSREHAIVAFDSLLNKNMLSYEHLRMTLAGMPDSHEWTMRLVDAGCGSGLETLARLRLRSRNLRVRSQVNIPPVGWIDLLVGDRLIVELDSRAHHDNPEAYERDRARDLALVELGYLVVRVTYRRVMRDWASVERAILAVVRRGEHRWQASHRSAGIATWLP